MASTTNAKKEIIDFLWEWANPKGDWTKLLVDKIVKTEAAPPSTERQNIFDYFIDSLRTTKKLTPMAIVSFIGQDEKLQKNIISSGEVSKELLISSFF